MKWIPLLLIATALLLSSCATTQQGPGKIGTDYDEDPTAQSARAAHMHGNIRRGTF
jgi:hypothetical protein